MAIFAAPKAPRNFFPPVNELHCPHQIFDWGIAPISIKNLGIAIHQKFEWCTPVGSIAQFPLRKGVYCMVFDGKWSRASLVRILTLTTFPNPLLSPLTLVLYLTLYYWPTLPHLNHTRPRPDCLIPALTTFCQTLTTFYESRPLLSPPSMLDPYLTGFTNPDTLRPKLEFLPQSLTIS